MDPSAASWLGLDQDYELDGNGSENGSRLPSSDNDALDGEASVGGSPSEDLDLNSESKRRDAAVDFIDEGMGTGEDLTSKCESNGSIIGTPTSSGSFRQGTERETTPQAPQDEYLSTVMEATEDGTQVTQGTTAHCLGESASSRADVVLSARSMPGSRRRPGTWDAGSSHGAGCLLDVDMAASQEMPMQYIGHGISAAGSMLHMDTEEDEDDSRSGSGSGRGDTSGTAGDDEDEDEDEDEEAHSDGSSESDLDGHLDRVLK